ncbi:tetratricopeptide repeat protein [Thermobrachium celere]|uniref:tetratricopeptide repeat protein n=1 Tax=Thermobrachium celere TaxID=53422 RepID=UPI001941CDF6|nr:hypothetical protein [Thermobrachium celere]GFR34990.1 hypothetical protein TCEA9_08020 [Thermobrachium celere]
MIKYKSDLKYIDFIKYLIEINYFIEQYDEVIKLYRTILKEVDDYTKRLVALSFFYKNKYLEAEVLFDELKQKKYSDAFYFSALINKRLGNYNEAIEDLLISLQVKDYSVCIWGYNSFLSYYELGEIYFYLEDFKKALMYYSYGYNSNKDYLFLNKMFIIFKILNYNTYVIESYLRDNLNIVGRELYINMMRGLRDTSRWEEVLRYSIFEDDLESIETRILAYYHIGEYSKALELLIIHFKYLDKELFSALGICCVLLENSLYSSRFADFVEMVKSQNLSELIEAHNYFAFNTEYKGKIIYLEALIKILIRSRNPKVAIFLRKLMSDDININYYEMLKMCYENGFYDICEQIIEEKYVDQKFDFNVLSINAKINFIKGNYQECEKYISYALMIKESDELKKTPLHVQNKKLYFNDIKVKGA